MKTGKKQKSRKSRKVRKTIKKRSHKMRGGGDWRFVQWLDTDDAYYRHDAETEYEVRGPHRNGKYMLFARDM
jgi:hypothetical protein